jgi:chemotaxis protein MotA
MIDITTVFGIIFSGIILYYGVIEGAGANLFFNINAIVIVIGGTLVATIITIPVKMISGLLKAFIGLFFEPYIESTHKTIQKFVRYSEIAISQGIENISDSPEFKIENNFIKKGLTMVVDGRKEDFIRDVLESHITETLSRHQMISDTFLTMSSFAPTFGLLGTVIGIIRVLQSLSDPKNIGSDMAIALLSTFYGIALANFILTPLAGKLKIRSIFEKKHKQLIIEGTICLHQEMLPIMVKQRLEAFLKEGQRK